MPAPDHVPAGASGDIAVQRDGDVCRLAGTIDFGTARRALEAVLPDVESGATARIDMGGITRSNSAGLALMIEWLGAARRGGHPLAFEHVPEGLRQLAGVCEVDDLIGARSTI